MSVDRLVRCANRDIVDVFPLYATVEVSGRERRSKAVAGLRGIADKALRYHLVITGVERKAMVLPK